MTSSSCHELTLVQYCTNIALATVCQRFCGCSQRQRFRRQGRWTDRRYRGNQSCYPSWSSLQRWLRRLHLARRDHLLPVYPWGLSDCLAHVRRTKLIASAGRYLISEPIRQSYYTIIAGHPIHRPTIIGSPDFQGIALIDTNFYIDNAWGKTKQVCGSWS
jgi:Pectate lyase superfamily protein